MGFILADTLNIGTTYNDAIASAIDLANQVLYVAATKGTNDYFNVFKISLTTFTLVGTVSIAVASATQPSACMSIDLTGRKLYVARRNIGGNNMLARIDLNTFTLDISNLIGNAIQYGLIYSGTTLYANTTNNITLLINPSNLVVTSSVTRSAIIAGGGFCVVQDQSGNRYWNNTSNPEHLSKNEPGTGLTLNNDVSYCTFSSQTMVFDSVNNLIYVSGTDYSTKSKVAIAKISTLSYTDVGSFILSSLAASTYGYSGIATDGTYIFLANGVNYYKVAIATGSIVNSITTGTVGVHQIQVDPTYQYVYYIGSVGGNAGVAKVSYGPTGTKTLSIDSLLLQHSLKTSGLDASLYRLPSPDTVKKPIKRLFGYKRNIN